MSLRSITDIQDDEIHQRIDKILSEKIHSLDQFIISAYIFYHDIHYHYKLEYFSISTIHILNVDDLNKTTIETLKHLYSNTKLSVQLKTNLMHRLERDMMKNLCKKQLNIDQSTWECICVYINQCRNVFPPIRILIHYDVTESSTNFVVYSNIKEIFQLFNSIFANNLKPIHKIIYDILSKLLKHFSSNLILDELWIYSKNQNFRIRTNTLYNITKTIHYIVQCLKDKSGAVQTAAIECCVILEGLCNKNYPYNEISILHTIENLLLEEMSVMEVNFLLQKIQNSIEYHKYNDHWIDQIDLMELDNSQQKQEFTRNQHFMNTFQTSVRKNSKLLKMRPELISTCNYPLTESFRYPYSDICSVYSPSFHHDLKRLYPVNYTNRIRKKKIRSTEMYRTLSNQTDFNNEPYRQLNGSYLGISEQRKHLKPRKLDMNQSIRQYVDKMKTMKNVTNSSNIQEMDEDCSINWRNQHDYFEINRGLESLRTSVSHRRKQFLTDQLNKLNSETTLRGISNDQLSNLKKINTENDNCSLFINSEMWNTQDSSVYLPRKFHNDELNEQICKCSDQMLPYNWRNDVLCSTNRRFHTESENLTGSKMYRFNNDIHRHRYREESAINCNDYDKNVDQRKTISQQQQPQNATYLPQVKKKSPDYHRRRRKSKMLTSTNQNKLPKMKSIEEEIIHNFTSNNWEDQIKATSSIQDLLKTMNVKPLEIIFNDTKYMHLLINGIEKLSSVYVHNRISEDSSTKFLQQASFTTLEAFMACIDEAKAVQLMCTNLWDKFTRSNIRRNTIARMLNYIFCNKLQSGKKNGVLFKRLGNDGVERLINVVHQLTNDKMTSTRLYGRKILEQLMLITDINQIYKKVLDTKAY
ncbi:unnamed protein product [Heterobilharzia americana]|nr:unnamed protein product [Heterobilharzia americana]